MKKISDTIWDILNIICLRIKLLINNKLLLVVLAGYFVISTIIVATFFIASKDNSAIPIGIVDKDNTSHSKYILENLEKAPLIRVTKGEEDNLINKMKDGHINAVFVIKKGVGTNIENGNYSEIIEAYYTSNMKYAKLLSDVVLACMLDDICYNYAKSTYYSNRTKLDKVYTENQYREQIEKQYNNQDKTIGFDFDVVNIKSNKSVNKEIDTSLLYRQIIIGIIAIILLVICLLVGNIILDDYKNKVFLRVATTKMTHSGRLLGDVVSVWIIISGFVVIQGLLLIDKIGLDIFMQKAKFMLLIMLFTATISMIFVCITRIVDDIIIYQLLSGGIILLLGISGALYILGFIINNTVIKVTRYTPIANLINGYKNITLNNSCKNNIIGYVFTIIVIYFITYYVQKAKGDVSR